MVGWVGLQKLITGLGRFYPYKGGVRFKLIIYQIRLKTMSVKGDNGFLKLMK
jgi:hypothetical protein